MSYVYNIIVHNIMDWNNEERLKLIDHFWSNKIDFFFFNICRRHSGKILKTKTVYIKLYTWYLKLHFHYWCKVFRSLIAKFVFLCSRIHNECCICNLWIIHNSQMLIIKIISIFNIYVNRGKTLRH